MKKIILFLLINFSAIAQPIFCPTQILCDQSNNLESCQFETQSKSYWNKITGKNNLSGIYNNTYVSAPFYSYDQGYALCVYTHETTYNTLTLHAKPESNLEMLIQDHEAWHPEESWWECAPKYEGACPLQEQEALIVKNSGSENLYLSNDLIIYPGQFARLYKDDLSRGWVDIYAHTYYLGRVEVDLKNRLQITRIISASLDLSELSKIDDFNAVKVEQP